MKKSVILSLLLTACVIVGCSKPEDETPNSLQTNGLKGPVRSVEMLTYEASMRFGEIKKGELTSERDYRYSVAVCPGMYSEYDKDGNIVQLSVKDTQGKIIEMNKFEYFQKHLIGLTGYDQEGDLIRSWRYIVKDNRPVSMEVYNRANIYDSVACTFNGFKPQSIIYYKDGEFVQKEESTYENGMIAFNVFCNQEGENIYQEWKRNDPFMLTQYRIYDADDEYIVEDLTYDEKCLLTHYTRRGTAEYEEKDFTMEYLSFDDHGNWTRRVIYHDHQPLYLQKRIFAYY